MGILHKLVFILGKLDPRNEKWKERQIARVRDAMATAEKIEDSTIRERALGELEQQITGVNEAFEHNELDYGRKLYLIENCIYGVDIQPIAVQIAKMRFFISLIVDQKIDDSQTNRGVRPLPNLETKFVAANTLIGVNRPGQQLLHNREIDAKEAELRRVRERHFLARTLAQKRKYREQDNKLRAGIAELLKGDGWDKDTAKELASWDPYDQNAGADFFDVDWMFGLTEGFDIFIGNRQE
jgi:adenine-specific DNA-methyltransferase